MRFQIIVPPSLPQNIHTHPPYGAIYIGTSLQQEGHEVRIENGDIDKFDNAELLRRIKEFSPDVIGFSATVATFYKYIKETSHLIKEHFPKVKIVVGGGLAAAAEVVLNHTLTDIVVIGEGDFTIKELARRFANQQPYRDVAGICFREGNEIIKTSERTPILNLDILEYPDFNLINIGNYLIDVKSYVRDFFYYKNPDRRLFQPHRSKKMLRILLGRGCINSCSFCYRPVRGLRHFSFTYIFDYIEYLMKKFDINIFSFGDECFSANKIWAWKFLDELQRRKLDIMFQIFGTKVETMDRTLLCAFKDAGCFSIEYGFESGSQKILDIMEKRVSVRQNVEVARWTKETGIFTMPAFVLGMPGETTGTIKETIEFLKAIDYGIGWYQYTHAFAVPGTPLYEYAKLTGLISDEDKYLVSIYRFTPNDYIDSPDFINFTTESLEVVRNWPNLIHEAMLKHYTKNKVSYFIHKYIKPENVIFSIKKYGYIKTLIKIYKRFCVYRKTAVIKQNLSAQDDAKRKRHIEAINNFLIRNREAISLRKLIKQIMPESEICLIK